ncbi:26S proteasome subunit P45 family protein [Brugia malayi]|uniref:26S proteasome subunit P45 family protein n=2 Tax=Brugia TaxID=6278 RepID=A0A4E9FCR7_BRUMA|nr:26S proteasome subunit P45 family protein [Brugia malayi]VIO94587.1 26S proteasome subunit P45 family protein [Brugia malayi]
MDVPNEEKRIEEGEEDDNLEGDNDENQESNFDGWQSGPEETPEDERNTENEEYKPVNNGYDSPLSPLIIREKIESVLHFSSLPLVEDGTLECLLYQSWRTNYDSSMSPSLPADFFSVEHIQRRERELYNPGTHILQNLIDLVESAVPSIKPKWMPLEGENKMPDTDSLASVGQMGLQAMTPPNDNFGNNFSSPPFSPPQFPNYLSVASEHSTSNHLAQFNLNSSLSGTPPVTPTSHLPPGNLPSDLQNLKPSSSSESCRYCIATYKFPQDHDKKECPKLAWMKPCRVCHASGRLNHTFIESPILRVIRSVPLAWWFYNIILEHCPFKKKVVLKLKCGERNNNDKENKDNKND